MASNMANLDFSHFRMAVSCIVVVGAEVYADAHTVDIRYQRVDDNDGVDEVRRGAAFSDVVAVHGAAFLGGEVGYGPIAECYSVVHREIADVALGVMEAPLGDVVLRAHRQIYSKLAASPDFRRGESPGAPMP